MPNSKNFVRSNKIVSLTQQGKVRTFSKTNLALTILNNSEKEKISELKNELSKAKNLLLWNQIRRFAKKKYPQKIISAVDASGYIHQVLKKNITTQYTARR